MTSLPKLDSQLPTNSPQQREVAVLTRAIENVFRKLIRLLVGKISLTKLQKMIQIVFIEESERKLKTETPGKSVSLADLTLLTGVDTRTITKAKTYIDLNNPLHKDDAFLDGFMPMFKVFDVWLNDERFFDKESGKSKILKIKGDGATFDQLVKSTIQSRGLTPQHVLKRLSDIGVVEVDQLDGTVALIQQDNAFISSNDLDSLEIGFEAIGNLTTTLTHNIQSNLDRSPKYFQRGCWNYQFNPEKIDEVRNVIHNYLKETDNKSRNLLTSLADGEHRDGQLTAGIGLFYFEKSK